MNRIGAGWIVLGLAFIYFFVPLAMTVAFSLWQGGDSYGFASYRALAAAGPSCRAAFRSPSSSRWRPPPCWCSCCCRR